MEKVYPLDSHEYDSWAMSQAELVEGYMAPEQITWLYEHAHGECVELGSYKGRSATALGLKLKKCGGHLTCVDCGWANDALYGEFHANTSKHDLPITAMKVYSNQAVHQFADQSLDMVFIDSSHEYEQTFEEIILWLPKLKLTGLLCGHDYSHPAYPGLRKAVAELCTGFDVSHDIWFIRVNQFSQGHLNALAALRQCYLALQESSAGKLALQNIIQEKERIIQEKQNEVESKQLAVESSQAAIDDLRSRFLELKERFLDLKARNQSLNTRMSQLLEELNSIQASKFWKVRSFWANLKSHLVR